MRKSFAQEGVNNMRNIDRFRGCLIGGAAGDALGYAVEFMLTSKPRTQRYYLFPTRAALPLDHPDILGN